MAEDSAYTQGETGTEADTETATEAAAVAPPPDGSFTTDRLAVTEKGGVYYMNFVNGNTPTATVEGCQMGEILFDSVDAFLRRRPRRGFFPREYNKDHLLPHGRRHSDSEYGAAVLSRPA
ncbi:MAG: hypothetical protein L6V84_08820 [Oscillospiraceae bacterium]|nr:MAG: hypothetical protein L6V84_08820 [Oscillospiraceae bacterium]